VISSVDSGKGVVDVVGATVALTVPAIGFPTPRRLRLHPTALQLARYALVGGVGTALNVVLFLVARPWLSAVPANVVAIVLTTLVTTEANRRFTFRAGRGHRWRTLLQNVGTVAFYAFYGSAVLVLLHAVVDGPTALVESIAVASASVLGGVARFGVMRLWEFAPSTPGARADRASGAHCLPFAAPEEPKRLRAAMMDGDAALPPAPASVALGRGPSLCSPAHGEASAVGHPLRPGRGAPGRARGRARPAHDPSLGARGRRRVAHHRPPPGRPAAR
jgi:putative flippase GtrA